MLFTRKLTLVKQVFQELKLYLLLALSLLVSWYNKSQQMLCCYIYIDTAEKEAAFTMCMISNTPDRNTTPVTPSNYTVNSFVNINICCFQSFYMRLS